MALWFPNWVGVVGGGLQEKHTVGNRCSVADQARLHTGRYGVVTGVRIRLGLD